MRTEEQIATYKENRRQTDKERRQKAKAAKTNDDEPRLMQFFEVIVKSMGLSWAELARQTGMKQQSLSWMMISDDAKLSAIQNIMQKINVIIKPAYSNYAAKRELKACEKYKITGNLPIPDKFDNNSGYIDKCRAENGRLKFLADFMRMSGTSVTVLAKSIGIQENSVKLMFDNDDIRISRLYKIADTFNLQVEWEVNVADEF